MKPEYINKVNNIYYGHYVITIHMKTYVIYKHKYLWYILFKHILYIYI